MRRAVRGAWGLAIDWASLAAWLPTALRILFLLGVGLVVSLIYRALRGSRERR